MTRRELTQTQLVLQMLQEAGEAGCLTGDFLNAGIPRASARCDDLRKLGFNIPDAVRVRKGSWRFVLLSEGSDRESKVAGEDGRVSPPRFESDVPSERSNATTRDCEHGYFAAGGSMFCPECFAQGGSDSLFDLAPVSGTKSAITNEML